MSLEASRPERGPTSGRLEAELAMLRAENDRLRAALAPLPLAVPAHWGLTPQQTDFLSLLYRQAGCVAYARLGAALGGGRTPLSRAQLQVIACHLRRKTAPHGVEIEAYRGAGYGLTPEGQAAVRGAAKALARLRGE